MAICDRTSGKSSHRVGRQYLVCSFHRVGRQYLVCSFHRVGRQYLVPHALVILLLQTFTSEAFSLWSPQAYETTETRNHNPTTFGGQHQSSRTIPQTQSYVKPDAKKNFLVQQKLIDEQHLLHLGMHGYHPHPQQGQQSDLVPQIFPQQKQENQFLHHTGFMPVVPEAAHEIMLPTRKPSPATSTSNSPACNSVPLTPTQKPAQNPGQNPSQDPARYPEDWQQSPPANQPEEGSSNAETVTGPSDSGNRSAICYAKPNPGRCKGAFKRYYYNVTLDKCDCFFFGGCADEASPVAGDTYLASLQQCIKTCNPGNKLAGPRCSIALRPSVFFIDPTDDVEKMEGSQSWDVGDRKEKPVASSATV